MNDHLYSLHNEELVIVSEFYSGRLLFFFFTNSRDENKKYGRSVTAGSRLLGKPDLAKL